MAKPKNCIPVGEARQLQNNWDGTQGADIARAQGAEAVRSVTFSIDDLQDYINYVKEETNAQGIRVWFGSYGNDGTKNANKATVFFAPCATKEGDSKNNYEAEPMNFGQSGWPPFVY